MSDQRYQGSWIERLPFDLTRSHVLRFIVALALSTFLWGWIAQMTDPIVTRNYREMDIAVPTLDDSMIIVTTLPQVVVQVEGPESEFSELNRTDLRVYLDTSSIRGPGEYRLPVLVEAPSTSARISADPRQVQVQIDELVSDVLPLQARSTLPEEDPRTVSEIVPEVSQVTVSGPASAVDRVEEVVLPVSIDNRNETFTDIFTPYAVDANGQRVSEVEVLPSQVSTMVEIESRGKVISVIPVVNGVPAEGYSVQQRAVFPETIVVDGPSDELDSLLFVNTLPVDITGEMENVSEMVGLADLPPGVSVVDPADGQVEVRVALEDISTSTQSLSSLPVIAVNVPDGFTASIEPRAISITVDGPGALLAEMESSDVRVVVDVGGLEAGTHEVIPQVFLPRGVTWTSTSPERVQVTVDQNGGGTPVSTPSGALVAPSSRFMGDPLIAVGRRPG